MFWNADAHYTLARLVECVMKPCADTLCHIRVKYPACVTLPMGDVRGRVTLPHLRRFEIGTVSMADAIRLFDTMELQSATVTHAQFAVKHHQYVDGAVQRLLDKCGKFTFHA